MLWQLLVVTGMNGGQGTRYMGGSNKTESRSEISVDPSDHNPKYNHQTQTTRKLQAVLGHQLEVVSERPESLHLSPCIRKTKFGRDKV